MEAKGFEIRRATDDDAPALGRIHSAAWRQAYRDILPPAFLEGFSPERRAAYFARVLRESKSEQYLLLVRNEPRGLLAIGPAGEVEGAGEVHALYLLEDAIGHGYGRAAMDYAVHRLRALGFSRIVLTVLEDNARARRFYARYGFVPERGTMPITLGITVQERRYWLSEAAAPVG